ncbi:MAG: 3-ketoacyl-ACP reductase [Acidobacteriota bacterium]
MGSGQVRSGDEVAETTAGVARPVALVTGAARGIGRGCALALGRSGFDLALCDRSGEEEPELLPELLDGLRRELAGVGARSLALVGDVGEIEGHAAMIARVVDHFGRLDTLVNNAGVGVLQRGDLLEVTPASFDRCLTVNTRAVFFLSQAMARHLLRQGERDGRHRSIVTITSSNAVAVSIARGEYCVSKAGASMATQLFALRLAGEGIGVYEVRPGVIETAMTRPAKEKYDRMIAEEGLVPVGRWGQPADVAATVVAMAEGRLPYPVGLAVPVDGGMTMVRF